MTAENKNQQGIKVLNNPDSSHPFAVVYKPQGLPSAPVCEGDDSALTRTMVLFPEIKNIRGRKEIEYGLIHRIDNDTAGLVLIALTQDFYDFMIEHQKNGGFEKWYRACVHKDDDCASRLGGFPERNFYDGDEAIKKFTVTSFFRTFGPKGREVRPVTSDSGKAALKKTGKETEYTTEITVTDNKTACARITAGFRHQVRCHLAWAGFPIDGDRIYNPEVRNASPDSLAGIEKMKFEAYKISFDNPASQVRESFEI